MEQPDMFKKKMAILLKKAQIFIEGYISRKNNIDSNDLAFYNEMIINLKRMEDRLNG